MKLNNQILDSTFKPVSPGEVFKVYGSKDTVKQMITILTNNSIGCRCNLFSSVNVLAKLHTPLTRTVRTGWGEFFCAGVCSRAVMNVTLARCTRLQNEMITHMNVSKWATCPWLSWERSFEIVHFPSMIVIQLFCKYTRIHSDARWIAESRILILSWKCTETQIGYSFSFLTVSSRSGCCFVTAVAPLWTPDYIRLKPRLLCRQLLEIAGVSCKIQIVPFHN